MDEITERPIKDMALFNSLLHPICTATTLPTPYPIAYPIDSTATTATEHLHSHSHDDEEDEVGNLQNEEDEDDYDDDEEEEEPSSRLSSEGAAGNVPATPSPPASESTPGASLPSYQSQSPASKRGIKRSRASTAKERISKMPPCAAGKRSSIYRGVTRHRWTGRYEAHLWDKTTWNQNQNKKGKQVYLGAYDDEEAAARAYDLAALKYWGPGTLINFPVSDYTRDIDEMQGVSREDYLATLRRKSSGFSRGASKVRANRNLTSVRWDGQVTRSFVTSLPQFGANGTSLDNGIGKSVLGSSSLINLCHFMSWLQPPTMLTETAVNRSSEEQSSEGQKLSDQSSEEEKHHWTRVQECYEPYRLPSLGLPKKGKKISSAMSAMTALSQSSMFAKLEEKVQMKKYNESPKPKESSVSAFSALEAAMGMSEYESPSCSLSPLPSVEKKDNPNKQSEACNKYSSQKPPSCTEATLPTSPTCCEQKVNQQQIERLKNSGSAQTVHTPSTISFVHDQPTYIPEQIPGLWNGYDPFMNLHMQYSQQFHT